jgi:UDP-glucose 4-epimerase
MLAGQTVLVIGGLGFIGSHLTGVLAELGARVIVLDDFSNGTVNNLQNVVDVEIVRHDISDYHLPEAILGSNIQGIFNLACHPRSMSLKHPFRDLEVNACGVLNALNLAIYKNAKLVFTSNSGIYGEPNYLPIDEKHPDKPSTPYDVNKLASEYYMKIYHKVYGLPIAICRLAAVYGERQRVKDGWHPLIPEFVSKIIKGEPPAIYWDGNQTRDLIYVKDVVQGLIKAYESDTKDDVYILSTGVETSVNQVYQKVSSVLGKWIESNRADKTVGDIRRMLLSYKRANEVFGFKPEYSLDEGIANYIKWYMSQEA